MTGLSRRRSRVSPLVCVGEAKPRHRISSKTRGGGIGAKLGVYDDLSLCLSPGEPWLEHGIVEHRYKSCAPRRTWK